mgnify:CR=1 FL=1
MGMRVLLIFLILVVISCEAYIHVAGNGGYQNDCGSIDRPCGSIAKAINVSCTMYHEMNTTSIILVEPGTYRETDIAFSCPISMQ